MSTADEPRPQEESAERAGQELDRRKDANGVAVAEAGEGLGEDDREDDGPAGELGERDDDGPDTCSGRADADDKHLRRSAAPRELARTRRRSQNCARQATLGTYSAPSPTRQSRPYARMI